MLVVCAEFEELRARMSATQPTSTQAPLADLQHARSDLTSEGDDAWTIRLLVPQFFRPHPPTISETQRSKPPASFRMMLPPHDVTFGANPERV